MKVLLFFILLLPHLGYAQFKTPQISKRTNSPATNDVVRTASCSQNLPVDVYMRCIERLYGGGGRVNRNEVIQHPQIINVSQNCSHQIEIDTFLTCLKNYIHKASFTEEPEEVEQDSTESSIEI